MLPNIHNKRYLKNLTLGFVFSIISGLSFGQALVDNPCPIPAPAGAQWPLDGVCYNVSTAGMSYLYSSGTCGSWPGQNDAWAWFTGDGNNITISFNPTSLDAILHIFDASAGCGALVEVGCSDAVGNGGSESVSITPSVLGTVYLIRLEEYWNNAMTGCLSVTTTPPPPSGGGDNCASATRIACGDPILVGETTVGNTNDQGSYTCHTDALGIPITTPGGDHYYVIQWPDAANGGTIRLNFTNVADANDTRLELIALGNPCAPPACSGSGQLDITTGLFSTATNFYEFSVGPGIADYYFVVDSQNDGIDSYDLQVTCFLTGLVLDTTNSCASIPAGTPINQGYYQTWNGLAPPATAVPSTMIGTYTVCENVYLKNVGWEWLKYFDVTLGACWINPTNFTPNGNNNGFHSLGAAACSGNPGGLTGSWTASLAGNVISWVFIHPWRDNPPCVDVTAYGDGNQLNGNYSCALYTFCYDANVDPACNAYTGFQNGISATDDGIGGGAGSGVNSSNVTLGTTSPTVLPVTLLSFSARAVLKDGEYGVVLSWKTASEINNNFFTIERSVDGVYFEEVLRMDGAGNSTDLNNYFAVDENPYKGVSYYRLKQTDFDGAVEYFDMQAVNVTSIYDLTLFPNPVTSYLKVSFQSKKDNSQIHLKIYDVYGNIILDRNQLLVKGLNEVSINMKDFAQGLYFISVDSGEEHIQRLKFMKK